MKITSALYKHYYYYYYYKAAYDKIRTYLYLILQSCKNMGPIQRINTTESDSIWWVP